MTEQTLEERITHLVRLWIDNEEPAYRHRRWLAQRATSAFTLADALRDWVTGLATTNRGATGGMVGDIVTTSLAFVDWDDMAEGYLEEEVTA